MSVERSEQLPKIQVYFMAVAFMDNHVIYTYISISMYIYMYQKCTLEREQERQREK